MEEELGEPLPWPASLPRNVLRQMAELVLVGGCLLTVVTMVVVVAMVMVVVVVGCVVVMVLGGCGGDVVEENGRWRW